MILAELVDSADLLRAQILYIYKMTKVVIIDKYKSLYLQSSKY